jgi:zinc transport system permease protein
MLIIPAAARLLSSAPESMALVAAGIGSVSALVGLRAAYIFDTPAGPSIVCVAAVIFVVLSIVSSVRGSR